MSVVVTNLGFFDGLNDKEFACNVVDPDSIPGSERSPGGGHGNPLQYSCLRNSMDRGAWWATVTGCKESDTTRQLEHLSLTHPQVVSKTGED